MFYKNGAPYTQRYFLINYYSLQVEIASRRSTLLFLLFSFVFFLQQQNQDNNIQRAIKERLKQRQAKRKDRLLALAGDNLSEEEKEQIRLALEAEKEADKGDEIAAILAVVGELSDAETKVSERRLLGQLVDANNLTEDEKNALVSKLMENQRETEEKYNERKDYAEAALRAKLEARRKLREEKNKEEALRKEMDALSGNRVSSTTCGPYTAK